jgi:hypothetical protein
VICEQVLEHVIDPWRAAGNLQRMCRPGGLVLVNMPFLIRIHDHPGDYWRFTPDALRFLLTAVGLDVQWVRSWGNRSCVRANFDVWRRYRPWHSLRNEDPLPVVVWRLPVDAVRDARVSFSGAELERVRIEYNSVRLHAAIGASHPTTNTKTAATPCAPPAATACW